MKKLYFGSNLKMYKGIEQTKEYLCRLNNLLQNIPEENTEFFIIPSYTSLQAAREVCNSGKIRIGAQNMCWEEEGQFTGEVSPCMLEEIGVRFVMVGHSERRHIFKETDIQENYKVKTALKHNFTALLCVGETAEEKEAGVAVETLRRQLKIGFSNLKESDAANVWVAYEPVWSIGVQGTPASAEYAESIHAEIKKCLREIFGENADKIPVLYGGSVNKENANELIIQPSIDGLFVGRAAWNPEQFFQLINNALETIKHTS